MKFGIFLGTQHPETDDMAQRLRDLRDQVREARAVGFDSIWAGQHFLTDPLAMIQPMPLLAWLAAEAEGMTLGTNILVLSLLNPIQVAEEAATLDLITGGRFVLGVGLGYRSVEDHVFGVLPKEKAGRLAESVTVIRRLFTEDRVTFEGVYLNVKNLHLSLRGVRKGGPPLWIAALVDAAVRRAAEIGDAWIITFYPSMKMLKPQMALYKQAAVAAGRPLPQEYPAIKEVYVAPTTEQAVREARPYIEGKYRAYASWGQDRFLPEDEKFDQPWERFAPGRFIIGDPGTVIREIEWYEQEIGLNHIIGRIQWPGLPQAQALRCIRLMGERVIPYFRARDEQRRKEA
jgi:alkanesulfonate monooxygenase SsuD/methylene tetrahydromethanopterin reductase-like flavin-dependent oxidoreductase (luciferase family)